MSEIELVSPLRGWVSPLAETPDAVFADLIAGDGVAIDPLGDTVHAPCAATVVSIAATKHAITLRTPEGAVILIHVGLETVGLGGAGLDTLVCVGDSVAAGTPLIRFDLSLLAERAKSLITPVLVINTEAFRVTTRHLDRVAEVGMPLMRLEAVAQAHASAPATGGPVAEAKVILEAAHGLHARPSARLAKVARAQSARLTLGTATQMADARSPSALMTLGLKAGTALTLRAEGEGVESALAALVAELMAINADEGTGHGVTVSAPAATVSAAPVADPDPLVGWDGRNLKGVCASPGLAIGTIHRLSQQAFDLPEQGQGVDSETGAFHVALDTLRAKLRTQAETAKSHTRDILLAHIELLEDPALIETSLASIKAGRSAAFAWNAATEAQARQMAALSDAHLAARAADLRDLQRQLLMILTGQGTDLTTLPSGTVLVADDLLPSDVVALSPQNLPGQPVVGLITARGGATTHAAILAQSAGLPMLAAAGPRALSVAEGTSVILNATGGEAELNPDPARIRTVQSALEHRVAHLAAAKAEAHKICHTQDGTRIEVFANLGAAGQASGAVSLGAEGVGLLRTEFLFLERQTAPTTEEQAETYQAIADAFAGRPVIVRTMDIGGDKPIPYLPLPQEENPALGLRGIRTSFWRPDLLRQQLEAIVRVTPVGACKIMLPMVVCVEEVQKVRALLDEIRAAEGVRETIPLGIMIETPAAAVLADQLATVADFFSIGTNDLSQYVLAMDRADTQLAARLDALDPAVLRMIRMTVEGATRHGRWVGVCGGAASDLVAAPLLIGLGVTELSATPARIPELKALIRTLDLETCRQVALKALDLTSAGEIRTLVTRTWPQLADPSLAGAD
ncbi:MAG: phosphoenolpyruvate--protein phosphotransferase [Asticcacaulis sp.]